MGLNFLLCNMKVGLQEHAAWLFMCSGRGCWGWTVVIATVIDDLPRTGTGCFLQLSFNPLSSPTAAPRVALVPVIVLILCRNSEFFFEPGAYLFILCWALQIMQPVLIQGLP